MIDPLYPAAALAIAGAVGFFLWLKEAHRNGTQRSHPPIEVAMTRAGVEDDGKVITLPPASIDNLVDQVRMIEGRRTAVATRHAAERASLAWQQKIQLDDLEKRQALESKAAEDELARAHDMMLKALATRLGVDAALLSAGDAPADPPPATEGEEAGQ